MGGFVLSTSLTAENKSMSEKKSQRKSFYIIAVMLPIIILAATETILRVADYRPTEPLFIESASLKGYLQPNENVIKRFFPSPEMAPDVSPDTQYFLQRKPSNSFRIVVQGGSTAAGFPYGRWGSLAGMLQQRFKRLYPDKKIEVINTAMASVNSYTLLDFVDEIIQIEPDLVLIYAGHNEYLGIMGVGSAYASRGGHAANLMYLKFKEFKLYRLVESIYYGVFSQSERGSTDERTLMAQIAKNKDIALDSDTFRLGIEQFKDNMSLILAEYQTYDIPVITGDLVSNEKDQVPFSAISQPQSEAATYYRQGQSALSAKQTKQAKHYFDLARDHDTLRFRAPSVFNQVIGELALGDGISLANVEKRMRQDTADGIIGNKHMLEHLHPTVRGYFVLSDAYVDAIVETGLLTTPASQTMDQQQAWLEQPVTRADALYGEFKVLRLTSDYPFTVTPKEVRLPDKSTLEKQALHWRVEGKSWIKINQQLLTLYQKQKDIPESAKIAGLLADALPNQHQLTFIAGMLYKQSDNLPLSTHHLIRAVELNPKDAKGRISLAQNYFMQGQLDDSLRQLKRVKKDQPNHPQVDKLITMVERALVLP